MVIVRSTADAPINIAGDALELRLNAPALTGADDNPNTAEGTCAHNVSPADFTADGDGDPTTFKHVFNVTQSDASNVQGRPFWIEQIFEWRRVAPATSSPCSVGREQTPAVARPG